MRLVWLPFEHLDLLRRLDEGVMRRTYLVYRIYDLLLFLGDLVVEIGANGLYEFPMRT